MSFQLPPGVGLVTGSGGLLSNVPDVRRRQISRINAYVRGDRFNAKANRRLSKAEHKSKVAQRRLPEGMCLVQV